MAARSRWAASQFSSSLPIMHRPSESAPSTRKSTSARIFRLPRISYLGREPHRAGSIAWSNLNAKANEMLAYLNIDIDVRQSLDMYPVAIQQMGGDRPSTGGFGEGLDSR